MNIRVSIIFFFAFVIGISSCKKGNDTPSPKMYSHLNVINASADTVNFYVNGSRLNNGSNIYPAASTGYYNVAAGQENYQVKRAFNQVNNSVQTLFSSTLKLDTGANTYYSLFIAGETAPQAFLTADMLQRDTVVNTCYVRFVNASSSAGSLDFMAGDKVFSNQAFQSASGFVLVTVGTGLTPISLYLSGQSTPITSGAYNLTVGKSYTFYAEGNIGGTGTSAFNLGAMINYN